jgi:hypothetical protein
MPRGPRGEKRPADVVGAAILIGRLATGEAQETLPKTRRAEGGKIGGKARAQALSPEKRKKIAKKAAAARWNKQ